MQLEYKIESEELFVFDPVTDDDKCQIDLPEFKSWLRDKNLDFGKLENDSIIDFAIKFDQRSDLFERIGQIIKP